MRTSLLLALPFVAGIGACGSPGGTGGTGGGVAIKAGDTSCDVATTQFSPGPISFEVENVGRDVTEVYVYGKNKEGRFERIAGEVENIAPGTRSKLAVTVTGGEYEVACKPGQQGPGIRRTITVSGPTAGSAAAKYDREVAVTAKEYSFTGLTGFTAAVGERIEFKLSNAGTTAHEFEVIGPDGTVIGEVGPTGPGKDGETIITFAKPGTYTYKCGLADHAARGMQGSFVVS